MAHEEFLSVIRAEDFTFSMISFAHIRLLWPDP
jgi:hypothetical protein